MPFLAIWCRVIEHSKGHIMSTERGKFRYLTAGEIMYCRMIFGDAIEYSRVKIYNKKWIAMQKNDVAMTPNGNIYYPEGMFQEDFSSVGANDPDLRIFIHEMVHVWQYQHGYHVKLNGVFSFNKSRYSYELSEDRKLADYNMEAQADLIADYFLLLKFGDAGGYHLFESRYRCSDCTDDLIRRYKAVLSEFILNPHDKINLPGGRGRKISRSDKLRPRRGGP